MVKRIILLIGLVFGIISANICSGDEPAAIKVFISQVVDHPALDRTKDGIVDVLNKSGENIELQTSSAQANPSLAGQIATQYLSEKPDIVVGIGTVSAQSFAKAAAQGRTKLIFSSITDPLGAGLVDSLSRPGRNSSGVSNFVPLEPQLVLFKRLLPKLKTLGVLYNPGEANSVVIIDRLKIICPKYGIILIPQIASKSADVAQSAKILVTQVDAIFISNDNTTLSALANIIKIADKENIPVFVSDTDAVELGAIAALGPNQYEIGRQTGEMIMRVLKGEDINNMAVEFPQKTELFVNKKVRNFGIKLPTDLLAKVKWVG